MSNKLNGLSLAQVNLLLRALQEIEIEESEQDNHDYLISQLYDIRSYLEQK